MANFQIPFGNASQSFSIPDPIATSIIFPQSTPAAPDPGAAIITALDHPIDFEWSSIRPQSTVAITVNDKTRPVPNHLLLPPLLDRLDKAGVPDENITLWIATGSHPPMAPEEFLRILPPAIIEKYHVRSHEIDEFANQILLETTSRGTPVWVNKAFYHADVKIVVGDIEPHHFAGYSGGFKSGAIGMAGRPTINHNHKLLTDPNAWIGVFENNPLRQDIEEIGAMMGIDLALNAVLNQEKEIVSVFCGEPHQVILRAIPLVREICGTIQPKKFDLVIASAGGYPKDINFYQAQKALTHASMFCKPAGTIILAAACPEGTGNRAYEEFMSNVHSIEDVFHRFEQQEFRVGPHKAYQVARLLSVFRIILVSSIPDSLVRQLLMRPSESVQEAVNLFLTMADPSPQIAVLPHATTTIAR